MKLFGWSSFDGTFI